MNASLVRLVSSLFILLLVLNHAGAQGTTDYGISTIEFNPQGSIMLTASADKSIKLWSVQTGKLLRTLEGHSDVIRSARFESEGKFISSVSEKELVIWEVETGKVIKSFNGRNSLYDWRHNNLSWFFHNDSIVQYRFSDHTLTMEKPVPGVEFLNPRFSPDGSKVLYRNSEEWNYLLDLKTGAQSELAAMTHFDFDENGDAQEVPDQSWLENEIYNNDANENIDREGDFIYSTGLKVKLWRNSPIPLLEITPAKESTIQSVNVSAKGKYLVMFYSNGKIEVWDIPGKKQVFHYRNQYYSPIICFTKDEKKIGLGYPDGSVEIIEINPQPISTQLAGHSTQNMFRKQYVPELTLPAGHATPITIMHFTANKKYLITGDNNGNIKLWNYATRNLVRSFQWNVEINGLETDPEALWITASHFANTGGTIKKIWEALTGKVILKEFDMPMGAVKSYTEIQGDSIVLINPKAPVKTKSFYAPNHRVRFVDEEGDFFVSLNYDGSQTTIYSWDVKTGTIIWQQPIAIDEATFSANGKYAFSQVLNDSTASILDMSNGKLLKTFPYRNNILLSRFSPDEQMLAFYNSNGPDYRLGTLNLVTVHGDLKRTWTISTPAEIEPQLIFSPDGKEIVVGRWNGQISIWNTDGKSLGDVSQLRPPVYTTLSYQPELMSDNLYRAFDFKSNQTIFSADAYAYQHENKLILMNKKQLEIRSLPDYKLLFTKDSASNAFRSPYHFIRLSEGSTYALFYNPKKEVEVWNINSKSLLTKYYVGIDTANIADMISLRSGMQFYNDYYFDFNNSIHLDLASGRDLFEKEKWMQVKELAPDWLAVQSMDKTFQLFNPITGKKIAIKKDFLFDSTQQINDNYIRIKGNKQTAIVDVQKGIVVKGMLPVKKNADYGEDETVYTWQDYTIRQYFIEYSFPTFDVTTSKGEVIWQGEMWQTLLAKHKIKSQSYLIASMPYTEFPELLMKQVVFNMTTKQVEFETRGEIVLVDTVNQQITVQERDSYLYVYDLKSKNQLLKWIQLDANNKIEMTSTGLFDSSPGALDKLYFVQGLDIIQLNQLKDRYYEPGIWKKVMNGEPLRNVIGFKSIELPPDVQVGLVDAKGYLPIKLSNRGGGIGEVNVFINGKEVIKDARQANTKTDVPVLSLNVFVGTDKNIIKGQENLIAVKAWNADHWVVSRGQMVSYESKEVEKYTPSIHILTCGVSDYTGDEIDLKYAAKDASDVSLALQLGAKKLFGAEKSYVYNLVTSGPKESYPTKANILKAFEKISAMAHPLDVFVMYVSGHGINYGGQEGDWHYLTQEAYTGSASAYNDPAIRQQTTISSNELVELFKKVPALKQVLLIDACASGKVVDNMIAQKDIESSTLRALDRMRDRTGMHIITGCTADAVSYEASKYGQGVLTYSLLEGIRGAALREDQYVDVNKLFQYAQERVPQLAEGIGGIQSPQVFSPQGAQSFDIGLLTDQEKKSIPISKIRPVYIRSNFIDDDQLEDALQLGKVIDESLNDAASKSVNSTIIFVDVRDYPEGCKLSGRYRQEQGVIKLKLRKRCDGQDITVEIEGQSVGEVKDKVLSVIGG
jgi:WD40 repeat protein